MIEDKLATAQGTWKEGENWKVVTPEGKVIFELQGNFNEKTVMQAIRLARLAEENAFNAGIQFQKKVKEAGDNMQVKQLLSENASLRNMNLHLSNQLEMMVEKGERN